MALSGIWAWNLETPLTLAILFGIAAILGVCSWLARRHRPALVSLGVASCVFFVFGIVASINLNTNWWFQFGNVFGMTSADTSGDIDQAKKHADDQNIPTTGRRVSATIPATESGVTAREAVIWLPPAWYETPRPKLPVIMMYHGTPGGPGQVLDNGAQAALEKLQSENHGVAPIAINPDINGTGPGDSECVDGPAGKWETYLATDVVDYAKTELGVSTNPQQWATMGFSEGGYCSLMLAFKHQDTFKAAVSASGYDAPSDISLSAEAKAAYTVSNLITNGTDNAAMAIFGGIGTTGTEPPGYNKVIETACADQVEVVSMTYQGLGDVSGVWAPTFTAAVPWLAFRFGITTEPAQLPSDAKLCNMPAPKPGQGPS